MDLQLDGRVALVTGASGAIGDAIAQALAREGADVALAWHRNRDRAESLVPGIRAAGRACSVHLDLSDPDTVAHAVGEVESQLGPISVLVANAVVWPDGGSEWASMVRCVTANVVGTAAVAEAVLPGMHAMGWGRIVMVSSDVVDQPMPGAVTYPAAKGAIEATARVLAVREAPRGILVNVVRPGFTRTDRVLGEPAFANAMEVESAETPTGRICTPEDVAMTTTYLASGANTHVNGEIVSVSGGRALTR